MAFRQSHFPSFHAIGRPPSSFCMLTTSLKLLAPESKNPGKQKFSCGQPRPLLALGASLRVRLCVFVSISAGCNYPHHLLAMEIPRTLMIQHLTPTWHLLCPSGSFLGSLSILLSKYVNLRFSVVSGLFIIGGSFSTSQQKVTMRSPTSCH